MAKKKVKSAPRRKKTTARKTAPKGSKRSAPKRAPKTDKPKVATAPAKAGPAAPPAAPRERVRDPRLPPPGTVIQKRDRHGAVRCECTVEEDGVRYAKKSYRSLSAAAMAAAKDLGLGGKTQNGFTFWGLSKPPRRGVDPLVSLDRAWERYRERVSSLIETGVTDDNRKQVRAAIETHAKAIIELRERIV